MDIAAYFRSVMELSHGIVLTLDLDGKVLHGNMLLEETIGIPMAKVKGKDWLVRAVPLAEHAQTRRFFKRCKSRSGIIEFRGRIQRRDGRTAVIDWHLKSIADTGGDPLSIMMVGHDVTGHVSRRRHLALECADLLERNRELTCLYGAARVAENLDRDLNEILSDILDLIPPAIQAPERSSVALIFEDQRLETQGYLDENVRFDAPVLVRNIQRGRLCVSTTPGEDGAPFAVKREEAELIAVVARQVGLIIAKKEALVSEEYCQIQLRHADRLAKIGQLAAGVAHELNEPLANILGFAQLAAKTDGLASQVKKDLDHIVSSSLHAREVIKKLMFFSRRLPPQKMRLKLNSVIEDALSILMPSAARQGITVHRNLAPRLPLITADPQQIKQVVINLATNAVQSMPGGGSLSINTQVGEANVFLRVEDTGCGMDPETIEQAFNPFFTTKDVDEGAGLGLSVVHGIVSAHEGTIDVHSIVGEGSTFTVSFPLTS
jgi:two-component system, NtrC family, sensor kinase